MKAEAGDGARIWGRYALPTFQIVLIAHVLGTVVATVRAAPETQLTVLGAGLGFAVGEALTWGASAGLFALAVRLAGVAVLAPVVLVPAGILVACWYGAGAMQDAVHMFYDSLGPRAAALESWRHVLQNPVAGPVLVFLLAPIFLLDSICGGHVFFPALGVEIIAVTILTLGGLGGFCASLPVLAVAMVRRVVRRARGRDSAAAPEYADVGTPACAPPPCGPSLHAPCQSAPA